MAVMTFTVDGRGRMPAEPTLHRTLPLASALALALLAPGARELRAQTPKVYFACYVPSSGTVYRIKEDGLPQECGVTKKQGQQIQHVEFNWTDGAGALRSIDSIGGDLAGTYASPTVIKLQGRGLSGAAPANGQVLAWNGLLGTWEPTSVSGGGGTSDHGALAGLADDDHPQYLLGDGVRNSLNGFAVTGTTGQGTIPASGAGVRLMWYPGKAAFRAGKVNANEWDDANIGQNSVAFGATATASGQNSFAFGTESMATGGNAIALGGNAAATGSSALATGSSTQASGVASLAGGTATHASGPYTVALGDGTTASGAAAVALGDETLASGVNSLAVGHNTTASGANSLAGGNASTATGNFSLAFGSEAYAGNQSAIALGSGTNATGMAAMALSGAAASGDFALAAGSGATAGGDYAVALGRDVYADAENAVAIGYRVSANGKKGVILLGDFSPVLDEMDAVQDNEFAVRASGGVRLRTSANLSTGCNLPAGSGSWQCTSSVHEKEGFEDLDGENVLARLATLPVRSWSYRSEAGVRHIGPTAQDFHAAFGLGTDDASIGVLDAAGVGLAGVKALEARTRELREENDALRAELAAVRAEIARLTAEVRSRVASQPEK